MSQKDKEKEWKNIQKFNKTRKICDCGLKIMDDPSNKMNWLCCFKCCSWICYDCLPVEFQKKLKTAYICKDCLQMLSED